jgi:hypothetical protein
MRSTKEDTVATELVAAVVIAHVGYLPRGETPFIQDPRWMAGRCEVEVV